MAERKRAERNRGRRTCDPEVADGAEVDIVVGVHGRAGQDACGRQMEVNTADYISGGFSSMLSRRHRVLISFEDIDNSCWRQGWLEHNQQE